IAPGPKTWQWASQAYAGIPNRGVLVLGSCASHVVTVFSVDERDAAGESAEYCRIVAEMPSNAGNTDALEARTMRRVTLRIVPFLMVCYFISFLDRVNLGFAALQMVKELHFSATVFGFGSGIFFVSYFLFEVPSNLLLEKFGARRWIARIMITWGVLAGAM